MRRARRRVWVRRWTMIVAFGLGVAGSLLVLRLDARVRTYLAGPPLGGVRLYAAPTALHVGADVPGGTLAQKLGRLGYRAIEDTRAPLAAGEYRTTGPIVQFAQRPSPAPWAPPPRTVHVLLRQRRIVDIRDVDANAALDHLELEPETLAVIGPAGPTLGAEVQAPPEVCRSAVLAAEDRNFFRHPGVDPVAIVRALVADLRRQGVAQGGSTLTQQLVKNALLSPRRTLGRKVQEALLAVILELRTTKEDILQRYISSVYLGVDEDLPVHGFAQGAQVYFGKPLPELGAAECALLAGMIRAPNALAPRRHEAEAVGRRNQVLRLMARHDMLDAATAEAATRAKVQLAQPRGRPVAALYVAAEVSRELERLVPADVAEAPGLTIFTGVDADAQREAERAVKRGLRALDGGRPRRERLQAALVAIDPWNGWVRALVGGRDYGSSPLDRAVRARRQPGSAFKPFVYLAALDPSRRTTGAPFTVVSQLEDTPLELRDGPRLWRPANFDGEFAGTIPVETALAESRNVATVRLALDVGLDAVASAATDCGVAGPLPRVPSLALGVAETSLLDLTAAYGVFASGGVRRSPALVVAVVSPAGEVLYSAPVDEQQVVAPNVAYLVTHLLEGVVDRGTGHPARAAGLRGAAAGKTGTTDDTRDAWFVGYTPETVAGVWVGYDAGGSTGLTGAQGALPIWTDFIRATASGRAAEEFPVPDDVVWRDVDPASGGLATAECPTVRREPFLPGTEPHTPCALHRPMWATVGDDLGHAVRGGGRAIESGGRHIRDWFRNLFR